MSEEVKPNELPDDEKDSDFAAVEDSAAAEDESEEDAPKSDTEWDGDRAPFEEHDGYQHVLSGNDRRDFVGVTPEYMNYANEYDRPILTDEERLKFTDQYDHLIGNANEDGTLVEEEAGEDNENTENLSGNGEENSIIGSSENGEQRTAQPPTSGMAGRSDDLRPAL